MELPISVMVVLFVAVVVGVGIIGFTNYTLTSAKERVDDLGRPINGAQGDKLISLPGDISKSMIESLSRQCITDSIKRVEMTTTNCFVVNAEGHDHAAITGLDNQKFIYENREWEYEVEIDDVNSRTLLIDYNPIQGRIIIRD